MELPDRFVVDVTATDIREGDSTCAHCPVALAARRVYPESNWEVKPHTAYAGGPFETVKYTHDAEDFILRFDTGQKVSPRTVTFTRKEQP